MTTVPPERVALSAERSDLLRQVAESFGAEDLLAGMGAAVDAAGGGFTMGYATVVLTAARPPIVHNEE